MQGATKLSQYNSQYNRNVVTQGAHSQTRHSSVRRNLCQDKQQTQSHKGQFGHTATYQQRHQHLQQAHQNTTIQHSKQGNSNFQTGRSLSNGRQSGQYNQAHNSVKRTQHALIPIYSNMNNQAGVNASSKPGKINNQQRQLQQQEFQTINFYTQSRSVKRTRDTNRPGQNISTKRNSSKQRNQLETSQQNTNANKLSIKKSKLVQQSVYQQHTIADNDNHSSQLNDSPSVIMAKRRNDSFVIINQSKDNIPQQSSSQNFILNNPNQISTTFSQLNPQTIQNLQSLNCTVVDDLLYSQNISAGGLNTQQSNTLVKNQEGVLSMPNLKAIKEEEGNTNTQVQTQNTTNNSMLNNQKGVISTQIANPNLKHFSASTTQHPQQVVSTQQSRQKFVRKNVVKKKFVLRDNNSQNLVTQKNSSYNKYHHNGTNLTAQSQQNQLNEVQRVRSDNRNQADTSNFYLGKNQYPQQDARKLVYREDIFQDSKESLVMINNNQKNSINTDLIGSLQGLYQQNSSNPVNHMNEHNFQAKSVQLNNINTYASNANNTLSSNDHHENYQNIVNNKNMPATLTSGGNNLINRNSDISQEVLILFKDSSQNDQPTKYQNQKSSHSNDNKMQVNKPGNGALFKSNKDDEVPKNVIEQQQSQIVQKQQKIPQQLVSKSNYNNVNRIDLITQQNRENNDSQIVNLDPVQSVTSIINMNDQSYTSQPNNNTLLLKFGANQQQVHSSDNPDLIKKLLLGQSGSTGSQQNINLNNQDLQTQENTSKGNKNNPINFYLNQSNQVLFMNKSIPTAGAGNVNTDTTTALANGPNIGNEPNVTTIVSQSQNNANSSLIQSLNYQRAMLSAANQQDIKDLQEIDENRNQIEKRMMNRQNMLNALQVQLESQDQAKQTSGAHQTLQLSTIDSNQNYPSTNLLASSQQNPFQVPQQATTHQTIHLSKASTKKSQNLLIPKPQQSNTQNSRKFSSVGRAHQKLQNHQNQSNIDTYNNNSGNFQKTYNNNKQIGGQGYHNSNSVKRNSTQQNTQSGRLNTQQQQNNQMTGNVSMGQYHTIYYNNTGPNKKVPQDVKSNTISSPSYKSKQVKRYQQQVNSVYGAGNALQERKKSGRAGSTTRGTRRIITTGQSTINADRTINQKTDQTNPHNTNQPRIANHNAQISSATQSSINTRLKTLETHSKRKQNLNQLQHNTKFYQQLSTTQQNINSQHPQHTQGRSVSAKRSTYQQQVNGSQAVVLNGTAQQMTGSNPYQQSQVQGGNKKQQQIKMPQGSKLMLNRGGVGKHHSSKDVFSSGSNAQSKRYCFNSIPEEQIVENSARKTGEESEQQQHKQDVLDTDVEQVQKTDEPELVIGLKPSSRRASIKKSIEEQKDLIIKQNSTRSRLQEINQGDKDKDLTVDDAKKQQVSSVVYNDDKITNIKLHATNNALQASDIPTVDFNKPNQSNIYNKSSLLGPNLASKTTLSATQIDKSNATNQRTTGNMLFQSNLINKQLMGTGQKQPNDTQQNNISKTNLLLSNNNNQQFHEKQAVSKLGLGSLQPSSQGFSRVAKSTNVLLLGQANNAKRQQGRYNAFSNFNNYASDMEEQVNDDTQINQNNQNDQVLCQEIEVQKNNNLNNSLDNNQLNLLEDDDVIKEETHHGEESHQTTGKNTGGEEQSKKQLTNQQNSDSQDEVIKQTPSIKQNSSHNHYGDGKYVRAQNKLDDSMNLLLSCSQQSLINPTRSIQDSPVMKGKKEEEKELIFEGYALKQSEQKSNIIHSDDEQVDERRGLDYSYKDPEQYFNEDNNLQQLSTYRKQQQAQKNQDINEDSLSIVNCGEDSFKNVPSVHTQNSKKQKAIELDDIDSPKVLNKNKNQQDHLAQCESQAEKIKTSFHNKSSLLEPISTNRKLRKNQNLIASFNDSEDDVLLDSNKNQYNLVYQQSDNSNYNKQKNQKVNESFISDKEEQAFQQDSEKFNDILINTSQGGSKKPLQLFKINTNVATRGGRANLNLKNSNNNDLTTTILQKNEQSSLQQISARKRYNDLNNQNE